MTTATATANTAANTANTANTNSVKASTARTTFRLEVAVAIDIDAPRERIWGLITDASRIPEWNSTITSLSGSIKEGEKIELKSTLDPSRTFKLKVSDVVANEQMKWSDGFAPMFRGVRTYRLEDLGGGRTRFSMSEVLSGLMLPMIAGSLPDFAPSFEAWAADLKREAERG